MVCNFGSGGRGGVLPIVDPRSERAAHWSVGYGAQPLEGEPRTLVMPPTTFASGLEAKDLL